ncbi:mannose-1-phosphate guanylyltransferase [Halobellus ordinarius]|uniref:mannose-1-phosphate guanylyltransferase n=1 Tax=Halobellus ordinarius TaxID=3075120 RepID=UPI0028809C82|nr:sugar phosphate nucleotidyltransferase [Halobellus sp. ZY16]
MTDAEPPVAPQEDPVVAVVLAGGTGTRLYPASRSDRPKQFLPLAGEESLLERTVSRAREVTDEVVVVTRKSYVDGVRERVPESTVLVEPVGRDTGPALLYATHWIDRTYDDPVVVALPSDHLVGEGFAPAIERGVAVAAATDRLVTFGVEPTRPETGYGYIEAAIDDAGEATQTGEPIDDAGEATQAGEPIDDADGSTETSTDRDVEWYPVRSFHEKPDADTAEAYVAAGHYWNAGLFAWRPAAFLEAAAASPLAELVDALRTAEDAYGDGEGAADGAGDLNDDPAVSAAFAAADPVSVDNAVFETWDRVAVVPVSFTWDDIGAWDALERVLAADEDGNVTAGDVTLRTLDAGDNVVAADGKHVSLVGVSDLAVVAWDDRVLVVPKGRAQAVKSLVGALRDRGEF